MTIAIDDVLARNRELRAIARLAQCAIRAHELSAFLQEAVGVAVDTLGAEGGAILEMLPGEELLLRAVVGRNAGLVGQPGVDGALRVSIHGSKRPWGVLTVFPASSSSGTDQEDFLQSVAEVVALAVERDQVEVTQRRENELLQTIFEHIPVMISFWDSSGRLSYVNREWEQTLGWTLEEARETDFLATLYPDIESRRHVLEFMRRCERQWADFRLQTRHGRIVDASWVRFELSDGTSIGFGLDITERKEAERALADSEARFARAFQASPVALAISTLNDGRILDVNESWLEMFGYRRDEVIGRSNAELRISVDPSSRAEILRQFREDGLVRNVELQARQKSGEVRDVIVSAVSVVLAGETESWLSSQIDITDRKRAEEERDRLLESERTARAAAESALERLRAIESITDGALQNLGLDELLQELLDRLRGALGTEFATVALIDERRQELYMRAVSSSTPRPRESIRAPLGHGVSAAIAADGQPRIVHDLAEVDLSQIVGITRAQILALSRSVVGAPLKVGGKVVGVVTAAAREPNRFTEDDLKLLLMVADRVAPAVERALLVETVQAGGERLKALSTRLLTVQEEERRRLAVELHDELGQVLTAVKINLQSIERTMDGESRAGNLGEAIASVDHAMRRVRDLALDLRPSVLDDLGLPAALRWYADRFGRDTGIDVHLSVDPALRLEPALETACFRVAQEALTNVMRHARAEHVWVGLRVVTGRTELKIGDDGIGFDVVAARDRAAGGVSVGLLGMEERVSSLGGEFEVRSVARKGTEVSARFPAVGRT